MAAGLESFSLTWAGAGNCAPLFTTDLHSIPHIFYLIYSASFSYHWQLIWYGMLISVSAPSCFCLCTVSVLWLLAIGMNCRIRRKSSILLQELGSWFEKALLKAATWWDVDVKCFLWYYGLCWIKSETFWIYYIRADSISVVKEEKLYAEEDVDDQGDEQVAHHKQSPKDCRTWRAWSLTSEKLDLTCLHNNYVTSTDWVGGRYHGC